MNHHANKHGGNKRHRFEFANDYRDRLTQAGLVLSGTSPDKSLVEIVELKNHPYFLGCQFHPEFKSRPDRPHPLFKDFMQAVKKQSALKKHSYAEKNT